MNHTRREIAKRRVSTAVGQVPGSKDLCVEKSLNERLRLGGQSFWTETSTERSEGWPRPSRTISGEAGGAHVAGSGPVLASLGPSGWAGPGCTFPSRPERTAHLVFHSSCCPGHGSWDQKDVATLSSQNSEGKTHPCCACTCILNLKNLTRQVTTTLDSAVLGSSRSLLSMF